MTTHLPIYQPLGVNQLATPQLYYSHVYTLSFSENSKGWVSFKTFNPEIGFSMNNDYYTANNGELWRHHSDIVDRNSFYARNPTSAINSASSITVVFNDEPSTVKSFTTLNYEGSQARVIENLNDAGDSVWADKYYNNEERFGWSVDRIETDQQTGTVMEFLNKEGKWFNHIMGDQTRWVNGATVDGGSPIGGGGNLDFQEFTTQGVGQVIGVPVIEP